MVGLVGIFHSFRFHFLVFGFKVAPLINRHRRNLHLGVNRHRWNLHLGVNRCCRKPKSRSKWAYVTFAKLNWKCITTLILSCVWNVDPQQPPLKIFKNNDDLFFKDFCQILMCKIQNSTSTYNLFVEVSRFLYTTQNQWQFNRSKEKLYFPLLPGFLKTSYKIQH